MQRDPQCIFCCIVAGEIPGDIVYEDDHVLAFRDIQPAAPTHLLVIPKTHIPDITALADADEALIVALMRAVATVARGVELAEQGFRVVTNSGSWGGQTVWHLHFHILGGRQLGTMG
jgi:histidine triad (HIT) family protein